MATLAQQTAWLEALEAAYFQGIAEVTYKERTVKYRSLAEMKRAINELKREIGAARPNVIKLTTDRGYR